MKIICIYLLMINCIEAMEVPKKESVLAERRQAPQLTVSIEENNQEQQQASCEFRSNCTRKTAAKFALSACVASSITVIVFLIKFYQK